MKLKELVRIWFEKWEEGDFLNIPVEDNFRHTSPYGTIESKEEYLNIVKANQDSFLGHHFELHNEIYNQNMGCVRYTTRKGNFSMDVSEWFFLGKNKINEIISYYNVKGEVSYDKDLPT